MKRLVVLFIAFLAISTAYSKDYARDLAIDIAAEYNYSIVHISPATWEHGPMYGLEMPTYSTYYNKEIITRYLSTRVMYDYCVPFSGDSELRYAILGIKRSVEHINIIFYKNTLWISMEYKYKDRH